MEDVDLFVSLEYCVAEGKATITKTNVKPELIDEEIFTNWIRDEQGKGKDSRKPNEKDTYQIKIGVDLTNDTFYTESDTGNKALTCGIILNSINRWFLGKSELEQLSTEEVERLKSSHKHIIPANYIRNS